MSKSPKVSVILVNYKSEAVTAECIESVLKTDYSPFEIIVVDNGSTARSWRFLQKRYGKNPGLRLFRSDQNLNYTGGNNLGARMARGGKLVFLNNDTIVEPGWLRALVDLHAAHPGSIVQPKFLDYHRKKIIDNAGGNYLFPGIGRGRGRGQKDTGLFNCPARVDYCPGTGYLIDRILFLRLGGFDDWYHIQYEDVDLALRAKRAGAACWYCPASRVYHRGAYTLKTQKLTGVNLYHLKKNRAMTAAKNYTGISRWLRLALLAGIDLAGSIRVTDHVPITLRAWGAAIARLRGKRFDKLADIVSRVSLNKEYPLYFEGQTVARYRLAAKYAPGREVLDIGCGKGDGTIILARAGAKRTVGIDYGRLAIRLARKHYRRANLEFYLGKAEELDHSGGKYDLVTAFELLEHLPVDCQAKFIRLTRRLLTKKGILMISTPNRRVGMPGCSRPIYPYHTRELTPGEFKRLLGKHFSKVHLYGLKNHNRRIVARMDELAKSPIYRLYQVFYPLKITHELMAYLPRKVVWFFSRHREIQARPGDFRLTDDPKRAPSLFAICRP